MTKKTYQKPAMEAMFFENESPILVISNVKASGLDKQDVLNFYSDGGGDQEEAW